MVFENNFYLKHRVYIQNHTGCHRYIKNKKLCPTHKLHDLRHTFATHCLECGINLKIVQRWLGHARLDTTANIYTHLQPEFVKRESEKFNFNPF